MHQVFLGFWLVHGLLVTTYYKTSLTGTLAVPFASPTIDTLRQLLNSDLQLVMRFEKVCSSDKSTSCWCISLASAATSAASQLQGGLIVWAMNYFVKRVKVETRDCVSYYETVWLVAEYLSRLDAMVQFMALSLSDTFEQIIFEFSGSTGSSTNVVLSK